ncbi:hypothetical protein K461DRAFT_318450 [Myriangium duriaei CBS 260.36]|uniref:Uncharacterized protein n=1 Tax=Myriangium duriaei CBS 260.36 TaxID=1168546 RepID=A0A9P4J632_9PEZI|nr:hypothetical protein K461DRAFT_318450 [Myriangium duriaei CBS 260.36]
MKATTALIGLLATCVAAGTVNPHLRATLDCTSAKANITMMEKHIADPTYFCNYYLATDRKNSPLPALASPGLSISCQCYLQGAKVTIPSAGSAKASPVPPLSKEQCDNSKANLINKAFTYGPAFCRYMEITNYEQSPILGLSVNDIMQGCRCVLPVPSTTMTTTTSRRTTTTTTLKQTSSSTHKLTTITTSTTSSKKTTATTTSNNKATTSGPKKTTATTKATEKAATTTRTTSKPSTSMTTTSKATSKKSSTTTTAKTRATSTTRATTRPTTTTTSSKAAITTTTSKKTTTTTTSKKATTTTTMRATTTTATALSPAATLASSYITVHLGGPTTATWTETSVTSGVYASPSSINVLTSWDGLNPDDALASCLSVADYYQYNTAAFTLQDFNLYVNKTGPAQGGTSEWWCAVYDDSKDNFPDTYEPSNEVSCSYVYRNIMSDSQVHSGSNPPSDSSSTAPSPSSSDPSSSHSASSTAGTTAGTTTTSSSSSSSIPSLSSSYITESLGGPTTATWSEATATSGATASPSSLYVLTSWDGLNSDAALSSCYTLAGSVQYHTAGFTDRVDFNMWVNTTGPATATTSEWWCSVYDNALAGSPDTYEADGVVGCSYVYKNIMH